VGRGRAEEKERGEMLAQAKPAGMMKLRRRVLKRRPQREGDSRVSDTAEHLILSFLRSSQGPAMMAKKKHEVEKGQSQYVFSCKTIIRGKHVTSWYDLAGNICLPDFLD